MANASSAGSPRRVRTRPSAFGHRRERQPGRDAETVDLRDQRLDLGERGQRLERQDVRAGVDEDGEAVVVEAPKGSDGEHVAVGAGVLRPVGAGRPVRSDGRGDPDRAGRSARSAAACRASCDGPAQEFSGAGGVDADGGEALEGGLVAGRRDDLRAGVEERPVGRRRPPRDRPPAGARTTGRRSGRGRAAPARWPVRRRARRRPRGEGLGQIDEEVDGHVTSVRGRVGLPRVGEGPVMTVPGGAHSESAGSARGVESGDDSRRSPPEEAPPPRRLCHGGRRGPTSLLVTGIGELVTNDPELGAGSAGTRARRRRRGRARPGRLGRSRRARPPPPTSASTPRAARSCPASSTPTRHLVFAGDRAAEFEARMAGRPYTAGGIRTTVAATRAAVRRRA